MRTRFDIGQASMQLQENFLSKIFGCRAIQQHTHCDAEHSSLMRADDARECGGIAVARTIQLLVRNHHQRFESLVNDG
jgi:hypothetical protein